MLLKPATAFMAYSEVFFRSFEPALFNRRNRERMKNETLSAMRSTQPNRQSTSPRVATQQSQAQLQQKSVLTPSQWVRAVLGVDTPFGHDHLPTVFE